MKDLTESTSTDASLVGRGDFLKQLTAMIATAQFTGLGPPRSPTAQPARSSARTFAVAPPDNMIGIQMGPHTMLDEGIEHCLDLCQETASIDTVFTYCHSYGGDLRKPLAWLAMDHGVPVIDQRTRKLPNVWVKQHDQYYKNTTLRHPKVDSTFAYHDRDLFAEMIKPLRARNMKVYPRILEAGGRGIENFSKVVTVNVYGKPTTVGCWNHPEYKAFWNATVEDLFRSYDVDGFHGVRSVPARSRMSFKAATKTARRASVSIAAHAGRRMASTPSARARDSRMCSSTSRE
jgi:hypothetical protein